MAKVKLDTCFEDDSASTAVGDLLKLFTELNKNGITIKFDGNWPNGWPEVTYIGPKKALKEMILKHWDDDDLFKFITR